MIGALIPLFIGTLVVGVPIFAALALASALVLSLFGTIDPVIIPMRMFTGINSFSLMAIPFFILAAELMRIGGLSSRLVDLATALVGWMPGGLASASVLACLLFGSISGSSPATVVAVGSIMFPALVAAGYDKKFSIGLLATAGTLGPIVPPSIALIIYGSVTSTSIGRLFAAGFIPALLVASILIAYCLVHAKLKGYTRSQFPSLRAIGAAFKGSAWGLGLPVVLLAGIYSGVFTPTESAAIACLYGLFVSVVVYRTVGFKELGAILSSAGLLSATLLLITAGASVFSWILAMDGSPAALSRAILTTTDSPFLIMLLLNGIMLFVGLFLDSASAIIILAPMLQPIAAQAGVEGVQFGIITLINFSIGMITPPVGLNVFVAMAISKMRIGEIFMACLPFVLLMLVALMLVTYVPMISLLIPELIYGR